MRCTAVPSAVACQDEAGRLWNVLTMLRFAIRASNGAASEARFGVHLCNDNRDRTPPLCLGDEPSADALAAWLPDAWQGRPEKVSATAAIESPGTAPP